MHHAITDHTCLLNYAKKKKNIVCSSKNVLFTTQNDQNSCDQFVINYNTKIKKIRMYYIFYIYVYTFIFVKQPRKFISS